MEPLVERIAARAESLGVQADLPVVVAVSGGIDSMVLLRSLVESGFKTHAVYVNHGIRPESASDEAWIADLTANLGIPFVAMNGAIPPGSNVQDAARRVRYEALERAASEIGATVVATGHTANDQAETLLMHLVRGSGLRGLAGMPDSRPIRAGSKVSLIRPLLSLSRTELVRFAERCGWPWLEDASNARSTYLRNRIRHDVLPILVAEGGPNTAARIAGAAAAVRHALHDGPARKLESLTIELADGAAIDLVPFRACPKHERDAIWIEALSRWAPEAPRSTRVLPELERLLSAQPGRRVELGPLTVWRDRDRLTFRSERDPTVDGPVRLDGPTVTPWGTLSVEPVTQEPRDDLTVNIPASILARPLRIRTWRPADRIESEIGVAPKKVSRLLSAARVAPSLRSRQLVLTSGDKIVWLVGISGIAAESPASSAEMIRLRWDPVVGLGVPR